MLESVHHHLIVPLYNSLSQMLLHWKNNEATNVNYKLYTNNFWSKLLLVCKNNISKSTLDKDALAYLFNSHIKMFDSLNNRKCKRRKSLKVSAFFIYVIFLVYMFVNLMSYSTLNYVANYGNPRIFLFLK